VITLTTQREKPAPESELVVTLGGVGGEKVMPVRLDGKPWPTLARRAALRERADPPAPPPPPPS